MKTNLSTQSAPESAALVSTAALSAVENGPVGFAACSVLALDSAADGTVRVQLLPDGYFSATDGRPYDVDGGRWLMDETAFDYLTTNAAGRRSDYVIDYEHQTLTAQANGGTAPASGWFAPDTLEYEPGVGLFARVRWTPKAAGYIKGEEYRYTSAVFEYDLKTGRPLKILHAALTNNPAADGMQAVAALSALPPTPKNPKPKGNTMNEHLKKLLAKVGITVPDDADDAAVAALCEQAGTAIAALTAKADKTSELETSVADLTAKVAAKTTENVDLTKFVPVEHYHELLTSTAALRAENDTLSVDQVIEKAKAQGKVFAAEEGYLRDVAKQKGTAALTAMLNDRPAIAALTATQTNGKKPPADPATNTAALSADEKAVIKQLGLSEADYLTQKKQETA